ncbi:MAG: hypothetical protein ACOH2E_00870 [Candidatus Paracaedibacter sp.]
MLSNFVKIFIKYSLSIFLLLSAIQDIFSTDKDWFVFVEKSPSIVRRGDDKKNPHVINMRLDIHVTDKKDSSRRPLQPVNQQKSRQSRFDVPQDIGVTIAGSNADVEISSQNKRPRPDFSSSHEESSEDSVLESQGPTLFDVLGEKQAYEVQILNDTLYKPEVSNMDVDLRLFTPTKINAYREAGGTTPELKRNISVLKTLHPIQIKDTENFPRQVDRVFSPAVRHLSRGTVGELLALKLVFHFPEQATTEPLVIETEEQRVARKERQRKEFEASEVLLGNFPKQLISEREKVLEPWIPYFKYVRMKKEDYSLGIGEKMRWSELGAAFMKYVAPQMEYAEIEDFEVYFSLSVINFDRENSTNKKKNHLIMSE